MRIIGGIHSSRKLLSPKGLSTRPTLDQVREAVFSSLGSSFDGGIFLDLYAGSGANGLEALSRGMSEAYFVDIDRDAIRCIKDNIEVLNEKEKAHVYQMRDLEALKLFEKEGLSFSVIYLDPPFDKQEYNSILEILNNTSLIMNGGIIVIESSVEDNFEKEWNNLRYIKEKKYGSCKISYFRKGEIK